MPAAPPPRPRTGRRPGPSRTREQIVAAALESFARDGFAGTSVRSIAARAGVDPALVHRFFGSKEGVLVAALDAAMNPGEHVPELVAGDPATLDERIVRYFLGVWEEPPRREGMIAVVRSAVSSEDAADLLRGFIGERVIEPVAASLGREDAALRAALVGSQLLGLAMVRYVIRLEPLASAPADVVAAAIAPNVRRYLTGDIN